MRQQIQTATLTDGWHCFRPGPPLLTEFQCAVLGVLRSAAGHFRTSGMQTSTITVLVNRLPQITIGVRKHSVRRSLVELERFGLAERVGAGKSAAWREVPRG